MTIDGSPNLQVKMPFRWAWLCLLAIFVGGIFIQSLGFLNHDVSWLLHATKRFLAGGSYSQDFFEMNPPMVLYIHIPPVLLAHITKLSLISSVRIYVFLIAAFSIFLCARLLKKILKPDSHVLYFATLLTLVFGYVISPASNFGQREHVAIMLIMPYLLGAVLRLQQRPLRNPVLIGLMAGVGFAIKPHLCVTLLLVEAYLFLKARRCASLFCQETIAIAFVFVSYVAAVLLFNRDYFSLIPYIYQFFAIFFASHDVFIDLFFNLRVAFIIEAIVIYSVFHKNSAYRDLATILMLSMVGFFIFYIAEPLAMDYHTIPMFVVAMLLSVFLLTEYLLSCYRQSVSSSQNKIAEAIIVSGIVLLLLWIPGRLVVDTTVRFISAGPKPTLPNPWVQYVKISANHRPFYAFSTNCRLTYPLVDYAGVESASRYECLWPVMYIEKLSKLHTPEAAAALEKQRIFFTHTIVEDMKRNMPSLVLVTPAINWTVFDGVTFDYLAFFSQSKEFRDIWKNYRYVTRFGGILIYKNIHDS